MSDGSLTVDGSTAAVLFSGVKKQLVPYSVFVLTVWMSYTNEYMYVTNDTKCHQTSEIIHIVHIVDGRKI